MHLLKRSLLAAAIVASAFTISAPAEAGVVDCTLGYPNTLLSNPHNPGYVGLPPNQVHAHGPVGYASHVVNGTFGYVNCVL